MKAIAAVSVRKTALACSAFSFCPPTHADGFVAVDFSNKHVFPLSIKFDQTRVADFERKSCILADLGWNIDPYPSVLATFADGLASYDCSDAHASQGASHRRLEVYSHSDIRSLCWCTNPY